MPDTHPGGLSPDQIKALWDHAAAAAHNAYAPYSNFHVGAAILLTTGETVTGCNVENASYRLTTCAEQTAIIRAVATFGPAIRLRAVVVLNRDNQPCQPCGACRQTIAEFADPTTPVFFPDAHGALTHLTVAELLPSSFCLSL